MEEEGSRYGEVERNNSWGGVALHELSLIKGTTRKNT